MDRRLTLIAGSGQIVPLLLQVIRNEGQSVYVIDVQGKVDPAWGNVIQIPPVELGRIIAEIVRVRTTHIALAGGITLSDRDREALASAVGLTGRVARTLGDTGLAAALWLKLTLLGIRVVGAHTLMPELLAQEGLIAGPPVDREVLTLAKRAVRVARQIGATDLGQAVVMSGRRAVAAEDAGGTDVLLARVRELRSEGRVGDGARYPLLLGKAMKPWQPRFVDLPAVGVLTVENAARAGISVIALEAGSSLVIDRASVAEAAKRTGVSVVGVHRG